MQTQIWISDRTESEPCSRSVDGHGGRRRMRTKGILGVACAEARSNGLTGDGVEVHGPASAAPVAGVANLLVGADDVGRHQGVNWMREKKIGPCWNWKGFRSAPRSPDSARAVRGGTRRRRGAETA